MTKWPSRKAAPLFDPARPADIPAVTVMLAAGGEEQKDRPAASVTKPGMPRRQFGSVSLNEGMRGDRDNARAKMAAAKVSSSLLLAAIAREDEAPADTEGRSARIQVAVTKMGEQIVKSVDAICASNRMMDTPYFRNEVRALVCGHVTYQWQRDGKLDPAGYEPMMFASFGGATEGGIGSMADDYVAACSKAARNPAELTEAALPHLTMTLSTVYFSVSRMISENGFGLDQEKLGQRLMVCIKDSAEKTFFSMYGGLDVSADTARYAMQNTINRASDFLQSEYRFAVKTERMALASGEKCDVSKLLGGVVSRMDRDMEIMADAARRLANDFSTHQFPHEKKLDGGEHAAAKGG